MLRESTGVDRVARSRFGLSVPADQALLRVAATEAGETMATALDLTGNRCLLPDGASISDATLARSKRTGSSALERAAEGLK
jgi:hypothetical protein